MSPGSSSRNSASSSASNSSNEASAESRSQSLAPDHSSSKLKKGEHTGKTSGGGDSATSRPRAGSDSTTVPRGPVSKMMDIFRHRSNSAVSSEDKRRSVSFALILLLFFNAILFH